MNTRVTTLQGANCGSLRCFAPVFRKWIENMTRASDEWENDVPWWYNERAQLSVLAGAVWRAGGTCFEEFSGRKRHKSSASHRLNVLYSGRVDVYVQLGSEEFIAEAKHTWSGYTQNTGRIAERIKRTLDIACEDVEQTRPFGMKQLGVVFVMPYFRASIKREISERLSDWISEFECIEADARAYVFPASGRSMRGDDGFYYPGVGLLMKAVPRRRIGKH